MQAASKINTITLSLLLLLFAGCQNTPPPKTSIQLQAFQQKEFETDKKIAFASVLSVFQDLGYTVKSADLDTGFITASSPTSAGFALFVGQTMTNTDATAFVEKSSKLNTKIRLNFVKRQKTSSGYGMQGQQDTPIEDPSVYQKAFTKIQKAIFVRQNLE